MCQKETLYRLLKTWFGGLTKYLQWKILLSVLNCQSIDKRIQQHKLDVSNSTLSNMVVSKRSYDNNFELPQRYLVLKLKGKVKENQCCNLHHYMCVHSTLTLSEMAACISINNCPNNKLTLSNLIYSGPLDDC